MKSIEPLEGLRQGLERAHPADEAGMHHVSDPALRAYFDQCVNEIALYVRRCIATHIAPVSQRIDCSRIAAHRLQLLLDLDSYPAYRVTIVDFTGCRIGYMVEFVGSPNPGASPSRTPAHLLLHSVILTGAHCEMVSFTRMNALEMNCSSATFVMFDLGDCQVESLNLRSTTVRKGCQISGSKVGYLEARDMCGRVGVDILRSDVYFMSMFSATIKDHFACHDSRFEMVPNLIGITLPDNFSLQQSQIAGKPKVDVPEYLAGRSSLVVQMASDRGPVSALYRALRLATKRTGGSHDLEAMYFALELRADRKAKHDRLTWVDRALSWLYDMLSIYGTSVPRSLFCFVGWNLLFTVVFTIAIETGPLLFKLALALPFGLTLGFPEGTVVALNPAYVGTEALGLALQNAFNPLAFLSSSAAMKVSNLGLAALSLLQSFGSVSIAALALLALRTRFQRASSSS